MTYKIQNQCVHIVSDPHPPTFQHIRTYNYINTYTQEYNLQYHLSKINLTNTKWGNVCHVPIQCTLVSNY